MHHPNLKRKIAGIKAKRSGQSFENTLELTARSQKIYAYPIPTGCKPIGVDGTGRLKYIPIKTACDFALLYNGKTIFIDTKTVNKDTFSYSEIDRSQLDYLRDFEIHGVLSGYLIHFRLCDQVVFYPAVVLKSLPPRESLKPENGQALGPLFSFQLLDLFK